jgi:hypothetical protein
MPIEELQAQSTAMLLDPHYALLHGFDAFDHYPRLGTHPGRTGRHLGRVHGRDFRAGGRRGGDQRSRQIAAHSGDILALVEETPDIPLTRTR